MASQNLVLSSPSFLRNRDKYYHLLQSAKVHTSNLNLFKEEIDKAFDKTLKMVCAYNELKQKHSFVVISRSITMPTEAVLISYGKKLGYIQAIIRYFTQQVTRYLTLLSEGEKNYSELQQSLASINHSDFEHDLVGMLQEFEFEESAEQI